MKHVLVGVAIGLLFAAILIFFGGVGWLLINAVGRETVIVGGIVVVLVAILAAVIDWLTEQKETP